MKNIITTVQTNEEFIYAIVAHIKKTAMFKPIEHAVESFINSEYYEDFNYYTSEDIKDILTSNMMLKFVSIENNRVLLTCLGHDFLELVGSKKELDLKIAEFYNNLQSVH